MTTIDLPAFIRDNYEIHEWRHACAILREDFAREYKDIFDALGRGDSYSASTTHMEKLLPRIQGGGGAGCPLNKHMTLKGGGIHE